MLVYHKQHFLLCAGQGDSSTSPFLPLISRLEQSRIALKTNEGDLSVSNKIIIYTSSALNTEILHRYWEKSRNDMRWGNLGYLTSFPCCSCCLLQLGFFCQYNWPESGQIFALVPRNALASDSGESGTILSNSSGVWKTFSKITRGASWAKNSNSGERLPTGNGKNANEMENLTTGE